jgi:hypothetical protein
MSPIASVPPSASARKAFFQLAWLEGSLPGFRSFGRQDSDASLFEFELEAEDPQNSSSGQPPLPRLSGRICQNNFTQAISVLGIGVSDTGFCFLEFRLAELDDRAEA